MFAWQATEQVTVNAFVRAAAMALRGLALLPFALLLARPAEAQYNVVFATSTLHNGNLGGLAGADSICQTRATIAGLTGTFKAWLSTASASALSRMGSARGFVRRDGAPLADTLSSLIDNRALLNAINRDENNVAVDIESAWTGTATNGLFSGGGSCGDWSNGSTGSATVGSPLGGPGLWTNYGTSACSNPLRLLCFQTNLNAALTVPPPTGRLVFLYSSSFAITAGGLAAADAACAADAQQAGMTGTFKALMATSTATAISRLDNANVNYQRRDGITVGTKAQLGAASPLSSGIWQLADGSYPTTSNVGIWTGSTSPDVAGTVSNTCTNWTSTAGTATVGTAGLLDTLWWNSEEVACNQSFPRLYCIQTDTPVTKRPRAFLTGD